MKISAWIKEAQEVFDKLPKGYWLYAANGSLCVMKYSRDGKRKLIGTGMDQDAMVGDLTVPNGEIDGGDW